MTRAPNRKWSFATALLFGACVVWMTSALLHRNDVEVTLSCASESAEDLLDVNAIVGAERITWNVLHPGESVHAWLDPSGENHQLHLSFRYRGRLVTWQSNEHPSENQIEQFVVFIDQNGVVHAR